MPSSVSFVPPLTKSGQSDGTNEKRPRLRRMRVANVMKTVWGLVVLWAAPIIGVALILIGLGVADRSVATIISLYVWSGVLLLVLLPGRQAKTVKGFATVLLSIAFLP